MNVLVDTSVWSLVLRRRVPDDSALERELTALIQEGRVMMIGAIRQELLSGVRGEVQFRKLRDRLRAFKDICLTRATTRRRPSASIDAARKACKAEASISSCAPCVYAGS